MRRKGLRVTGPMITRARISKRDPFLFYPREGSVFLARYPLQGITNWRWSQSPRFAELLAETMARSSSKSSVIEKDGKVARLLERSFLLARNTALSHLSQHIPVIWIPEAEDTANRETIRRFDDRFQNETTAQRVKLL